MIHSLNSSPQRIVDLDGANVTFASEEWRDCTEEDAPFTICRDVAGGALQFSLAFYRGGKEPRPTDADLLDLLVDWEQRSENPGPLTEPELFTSGPVRWVTATYRDERYREMDEGVDTFWRVWYGSDGLSYAYVTYCCLWPRREEKRADVEAMVRSFRFESPAAQQRVRTAVA